jgi:hypothetical protein
MSNGWQTQKERQAWLGRMRRFKEFHYQDCFSGSQKLKIPTGLKKGDRLSPDGTVQKADATENPAK